MDAANVSTSFIPLANCDVCNDGATCSAVLHDVVSGDASFMLCEECTRDLVLVCDTFRVDASFLPLSKRATQPQLF